MNLNSLKLIVQLLPLVIQLLKEAEELLPEKGTGAEKLNLVRSWLEASLGGIDELWPSLEKLISVTISFFNQVGTFKK
jgi:hypothetical protein